MKKEYLQALNSQNNQPRERFKYPKEERMSSEPSRPIKIPGMSDNHDKMVQDRYINKYLNIDSKTGIGKKIEILYRI